MAATIVLGAILVYQIITFYIIWDAKNTYRATGKLESTVLEEQIDNLIEGNIKGQILIFSHLDKKIIIEKKANKSRWWIELFGKEEVFEKVKFHLKYNEAYCDFISRKYYQQYIAFHQGVVFLGHKTDTINSILQKLVSQYFDTKEHVYFRSKNVRPSNSLSENEL